MWNAFLLSSLICEKIWAAFVKEHYRRTEAFLCQITMQKHNKKRRRRNVNRNVLPNVRSNDQTKANLVESNDEKVSELPTLPTDNKNVHVYIHVYI